MVPFQAFKSWSTSSHLALFGNELVKDTGGSTAQTFGPGSNKSTKSLPSDTGQLGTIISSAAGDF